MLKGIKIKPISRFPDERGFFYEIMRKDWKELFAEDTVVQSNFSFTYPNIIRAWHRHLRGQTDYFLALKGIIKICVFDEKTGELNEIVSSALNMQVVRMPGHYWHGFKALAMNQLCWYTSQRTCMIPLSRMKNADHGMTDTYSQNHKRQKR